ncbi:MAG: serine hydrolase [Bacteroidales bacterium]|nr:serine hydrolase [Bacteroidales bacterium]
MKSTLSFIILTLAIVFSVSAQPKTKENQQLSNAIDKILEEDYKADGPGVAVLVAKNGNILYHKGIGMANLELGVPMQADMIFRIGSITKQFTAVAILQLMEQGKLSLEDEITKFIPDYPTHDHKITIHHLLTHTSGIASYTGMKDWTPEVMKKDFTPLEMIDFFKDQPIDFEPGEEWRYNNSGYFLLGYIIEKVSGQTYEDYVSKHLFEPAGMVNSLYGNDRNILKNRAYGYQQGEHGYENANFLSMTQPYAAGSLMSTVEDMFRWNRTLISGKVVSQESLALAWTNYTLNNGSMINYGYGWMPGDVQGSPMIAHGGGINGFMTHEAYFPAEDLYVVLFLNCTCIGTEAAHKIAALALGKPFDYKEVEIEASKLEEYTGVYQNSSGNQRNIYIEDGKLISQRVGGGTFRIIPFEAEKFFFENSLTKIEFTRNRLNEVAAGIMKSSTGLPETWEKTELPLPEKRREIEVPEEILKTHVGNYELMPGFVLYITLEDGKLMAQATGQSTNELFAESESVFFLKVVEASLEFIKDENGKTVALILKQGGQELEGKRIQ